MIISSRNLPSLIMLVGISGSGKSEFINTLKNILVVCPDEIRKEETGDISDQSRNTKVWKVAKERVAKALSSGLDVILDATNVDSGERTRFVEGLPPHQLKAKIFNSTPKESYEKIQDALNKGVDRAEVAQHVLHRQYNKFDKESRPEQLKQEGFELL